MAGGKTRGTGSSMVARGFTALLFTLTLALWQGTAFAQANSLERITFTSLPGDRLQVSMSFANPPGEPTSFTIDNPARIALDFADTRNALPQRSQEIGVGLARSISTAEARDRTRVVVNLVRMMRYDTQVRGNDVILTLSPGADGAPAPAAATPGVTAVADRAAAPRTSREITNVDFRRGPEGEGRVIIHLSDPRTPVDVREQAGRVELSFPRASLPEELERRLDVVDFATPVQTIDAISEPDRVRVVVAASGLYDTLSYQMQDRLTLEIKPVSEAEAEEIRRDRFTYTGERLSLNFQDIEVRSVLQLIADFTDLNVVVSDSVTGNITLRLRNVPWDQALDIVLRSRGLDMREAGNVIYVAPSEEIAAREKLEFESQQAVQELAPLRAEFIQVNYARAEEVAAIIRSERATFMSDRGSLTVDNRTNTLLVQDTEAKLNDVRRLVDRLDVPVQQVLIETRIVIASDDFARDLGARFGVSGRGRDGRTTTGVAGNLTASDAIVGTTTPFPAGRPALANRLNVSLPASPANRGQFALSILRPDVLLDLEISALQVEGRGEIISSPRVITANGQTAMIKQGERIPYQEATSSGATAVQFIEAVLSTEVTPQITPNGNIILNIKVNKDNPGTLEVQGTPSIETREVETQVFVRNGETVVLGGVYEIDSLETLEKVPFFGDLPGLRHLFRRTGTSTRKAELLIFVTPKVIEEDMLDS
ncbi:pilus assembly protein PilQ [Thioalkalivibrio denitrificans]|uniref:Pilus assembly protein PilQ n=1 Tax=Thioalkalivibrio denitrificans TaxID=108003 RepID=A0A1V3NCY2_9GAMM|nr:pilus assembly protein PilQ [Thioalkalivibrio denitrificans]